MEKIKLNLTSVEVQPKVLEARWKYVIGKPYYDIDPDVAKTYYGITRKQYRKIMNK